jgi:hypothetical protein
MRKIVRRVRRVFRRSAPRVSAKRPLVRTLPENIEKKTPEQPVMSELDYPTQYHPDKHKNVRSDEGWRQT